MRKVSQEAAQAFIDETTAYLWGKDDNDLSKPALLRHKAVYRDDIEAAEAELLQEYEQMTQTSGQ